MEEVASVSKPELQSTHEASKHRDERDEQIILLSADEKDCFKEEVHSPMKKKKKNGYLKSNTKKVEESRIIFSKMSLKIYSVNSMFICLNEISLTFRLI